MKIHWGEPHNDLHLVFISGYTQARDMPLRAHGGSQRVKLMYGVSFGLTFIGFFRTINMGHFSDHWTPPGFPSPSPKD